MLQAQLHIEALDRILTDGDVFLGSFEGISGRNVVGLGDFVVPSKAPDALLGK